MNEELKIKLMQYLETIEKGVNQGADFVAEQAPLYVQEFLAWEFGNHCLWAVFNCLFVVAVWIASKRTSRVMLNAESRGANDMYMLPTIVAAFVCFGLLIAVAYHATDCVKVKVAPRVVIVESLQKAIK